MELQKKDPRVSGYQNGKVLYKQQPETPDERRFRIFGTHEFIGKGRLVDSVGQALQGSNSCKGSSILEGTGSADRRIEKPAVTVKTEEDLIMTVVKPKGIPAAAVTGRVNIDTDIGLPDIEIKN
jgi:hypothetical protein